MEDTKNQEEVTSAKRSGPKTGLAGGTIIPMNTPSEILPSVGLLFALKRAARALWDRLGLTIGLSLTWSLLMLIALNVAHTLPLGSRTVPAALLAPLLVTLLMAPATAGIYAVVWRLLASEPAAYADFWQAARQSAGLAVRLGLLNVAVVGILSFSLWFYAHTHGAAGIAAAFLSFDVLVLWGIMAVLHFPLLAAQEAGVFDTPEHQAKRGLWAVLRRAFFLALGRPGQAFGLLVVTLLLTALVLPLNGLNVILWPGIIAFVTASGTRSLLMQFAVIPLPQSEDIVPDEAFRLRLDKK